MSLRILSLLLAVLLAVLSVADATTIRWRQGTTAEWEAADPVLAAGEMGLDLTTRKLRIGDGVSTWTELSDYGDGATMTLAGPYDYLSVDGSELTLGPIDLAADVTGLLSWARISGRPTTLAGYGILDAIAAGTDAAVLTAGASTDGQVLTSDGLGGAAWETPAGGAETDPVASAALTAHIGAADPHAVYTTAAEAASAAPVQSVDGETGAVDLSNDYEPLGNIAGALTTHDNDPDAHSDVRLTLANITDAGSLVAQQFDNVAITGGYVTGLSALSVTDGFHIPGPYQNLVTGQYWGTAYNAAATSTIALNANDLRLVPFYVPIRRYFSEIRVEVTVASTAGSIRAAIYRWNATNTTLTQVTNSATDAVSTATTGVKVLTTADQVNLAPGLYLLAVGVDQAATVKAAAQTATSPLLGVDPADGRPYAMIRNAGWSYGTLPATMDPSGYTWQAAVTPPLAWFEIEELGIVEPPAERLTYDYLEDGLAIATANERDYPLVHAGGAQDGGSYSNAQFSKYGVLTRNGTGLATITAVKALNPNLLGLRYVSAFGLNNVFSNTWPTNVPFSTSGASTSLGDGIVFPGHFAYEPFTQLAAAITTAGQSSISVDDGSRFLVGDYAVIYDNATNFTNAEHVRVTAVSGNTLTIERGYKSTAATHAIDSRIAVHARAGGSPSTSEPLNWVMHQGSNCPQDGNGNRWNALFGAFWAANWDKDADYNTVAAVDGIIWDMDTPTLLTQQGGTIDTNNDGVEDDGFVSGVNVWRVGIEAMYDAIHAVDPDVMLVGGQKYALGWGNQVGTQFEVFPRDGEGSLVGDYSQLSGYYTDLMLGSYYRMTPHLSYQENMFKSPTGVYGSPGSTNKYFRFDLGMTLITGASFGTHTYAVGLTEDPWYDEYSVDLTPGATYGDAISGAPGNEAAARAGTGWLGAPLAAAYRVYGTEMDPANAVYTENFDSAITGWTGTNVSVSHDGADGGDSGNGSLATGVPTVLGTFISAIAKGNINLSLTPGSSYTLGFSARCSDWNHVQVAWVWPAVDNVFLVGPQWNRFVYTFTAPTPTSGTLDLHFRVGRDAISCKFDDLVLVPGNAQVFRRDFENGTVIANGSGASVTVNTGDTYQRIDGTQDAINDGSSGTSWLIDAWDAAILVAPSP